MRNTIQVASLDSCVKDALILKHSGCCFQDGINQPEKIRTVGQHSDKEEKQTHGNRGRQIQRGREVQDKEERKTYFKEKERD